MPIYLKFKLPLWKRHVMWSSKMSRNSLLLILKYSQLKGEIFFVFYCSAKFSITLEVNSQFLCSFLLNVVLKMSNTTIIDKAVLKPQVSPAFAFRYFCNHCNIGFDPIPVKVIGQEIGVIYLTKSTKRFVHKFI